MEQTTLNLARKWRSAQFAEIVGQDLVVRILQNSLFKNQFFPVYLLSGQRGCGKTSTARVFAAALNCHRLSDFQKNPSIKIPCLQCASCSAMVNAQHPDFIEIDAASYTGVDNIRNIIDTSSFLPVLGSKKIYLIDEVHMLSKAAFNAFLKILEEPPKFVVFILATTEIQKLPDTVRSRCFQLFFNPVVHSTVADHLEMICKKESIVYERAGLDIIAQMTQGSLRDAINLLEQARFASNNVTKSVVLSVLGYPDDQLLVDLLRATLHHDEQVVMNVFAQWGAQVISTEYVLKRCIELLYDCMVIKYQAQPKYAPSLFNDLQSVVNNISIDVMLQLFKSLCDLDYTLIKVSKKQLLFEATLLRFVLQRNVDKSVIKSDQALLQDEKKK